MATSDKADKEVKHLKAKPTGKARADGPKQAASAPVVPSTPLPAGGAVTVSRIPPSMPIESTLLGKADGGRPPAAPKAAAPRPGSSAATPTSGAATLAAPAAVPEAPAPRPASQSEPAPRPAVRPEPELVSQTVVQKVGFWPLALGGAVAALLGAGATIYAMPKIAPYLPAGWQAQAPHVDLDALRDEAAAAATQAARAEVASALANVQGMTADDAQMRAAVDEQVQAALAARPPLPAQAASTAGLPADLPARIADLQGQLDAQAGQIAALTARPQLDPQAMQQVQALAQGAVQVKADIDAAAAAAQDSLAAVRTEAQAATQRAQAVASVAVLGAALDGGNATPSEAVQQLEQAGVAVPAPLAQQDLPTLDQLQLGFDAPARAALTASLKAESQGQGALGAVGNFLRVQTGARSVEPREGTDPDAVLSRATALVAQGDLPTALDELKGLPPAGQDAMAGWVAQANAYLAAQSALSDVAKSLN